MYQLIDKESFTLILPSNDISSENESNCDFVVHYPKTFMFNQKMECGISNIIFPKCTSNSKINYILIDIIQDSIIGDKTLNILRQFKIDGVNVREIDFSPLIFIPVRFIELNSMDIKILDEKFNPVIFEKGSTIVSLVFRNIEYI